ncbi:MAG: exopolysaccharide biosynthesis protein [bacterium]|nr:exopolysaccharide biosynthesis protein [bacterium]
MAQAAARKKKAGLMSVLTLVRNAKSGTRLRFRNILVALEARGFGPLLLVPCIFIMLPTGAIPGVPDVGAIFMILVAAQIIVGRKTPWMPERMEELSVSAKKFDHAVKKVSPAVRKVDKLTRRRATVFTGPAFQKIAAVLIIAQSLLMMAIGMIPFVPVLLVAPIFLLALGFTARDGLLSIVGLSLMVIAGLGASLAVFL